MDQICPKMTDFVYNIWTTSYSLCLCAQTREDYNARIVSGEVCKKSKYLQNDLHTLKVLQ